MYTVYQAKTNPFQADRGGRGRQGCRDCPRQNAGCQARTHQVQKQTSRLRQLEGKLWYAPDAFDPLTDEELKDWGIE